MQEIKNIISKKTIKEGSIHKKDKIKYQYQDMAYNLAKEFGIIGKERTMLFGFIKRKLEKGYWWKIKEVTEYMKNKKIKSLRYFMSCFKKK